MASISAQNDVAFTTHCSEPRRLSQAAACGYSGINGPAVQA